MRIPPDWTSERASGWANLAHLIHDRCGWRSPLAYDIVIDERGVRAVVDGHECADERAHRETVEGLHARIERLETEVTALTSRKPCPRCRSTTWVFDDNLAHCDNGHPWHQPDPTPDPTSEETR